MSRYVVGVGLATAATPAELADLVATALAEAGADPADVRAVATVARRATHPAVEALGWPVVAVDLPPGAARAAGEGADRPAVAEPAALAGAGEGAVLVVPKRRSARATAAVARVADLNATELTTTDLTASGP